MILVTFISETIRLDLYNATTDKQVSIDEDRKASNETKQNDLFTLNKCVMFAI
jgi:hypothetical protein